MTSITISRWETFKNILVHLGLGHDHKWVSSILPPVRWELGYYCSVPLEQHVKKEEVTRCSGIGVLGLGSLRAVLEVGRGKDTESAS